MSDRNRMFAAQCVSTRVESVDVLIERVRAKTAKTTGVAAVLDLSQYAKLPAKCTREILEVAAEKVVLNASSVLPEINEARNRNIDDLPLIFVYYSNTDAPCYVIRTGYIDTKDTPVCFRVAALKQIKPAPPKSGSMGAQPDAPQIPLPPTLPKSSNINKTTVRTGQVVFSRLVELVHVWADVLDAEGGILPSGPTWWSWAEKDVGKVSDEEDEFLLYFLILGTCKNYAQRDFIKSEFANMCVRCATADPTFLGRLKKKQPEYALCYNTTMLKAMICTEFDKVSKFYEERYYSTDSDMVYSIPEYVKNCVNIIHAIYDTTNE